MNGIVSPVAPLHSSNGKDGEAAQPVDMLEGVRARKRAHPDQVSLAEHVQEPHTPAGVAHAKLSDANVPRLFAELWPTAKAHSLAKHQAVPPRERFRFNLAARAPVAGQTAAAAAK